MGKIVIEDKKNDPRIPEPALLLVNRDFKIRDAMALRRDRK